MHRLEEMKAWQKEQQNKLLKVQQQQEENFLKAQKQQVLNYLSQNKLSVKDDDDSSVDSKILDNSQAADEVLTLDPTSDYDTEESRKNRIKYLEALLNECYHKKALLEEMPISSSCQDFEKLLEMNLPQNEEKLYHKEPIEETEFERIESKPKQPFLRKGQGLARFNMTPEDFKRPVKMNFYRSRSHSTVRSNTSNNGRSNLSKPSSKNRPPVPLKSKFTSTGNIRNVRAPVSTLKPTQSAPSVSSSQNQLRTNFPPSILKKHSSQPAVGHSRQKESSALSPDADQKKKKKEQQELRVFEILEEKVGESSFCSTSSTIAKLMEDSDKSTLFKDRNDTHQTKPRTTSDEPEPRERTAEAEAASNHRKNQENDDTEVEDDDGWTDISSDEELGEKDKTGFTSDDSERLCSPPPNFQKHAHFSDDVVDQKPCVPTQTDSISQNTVGPFSTSFPEWSSLQKDQGFYQKSSVQYSITQKDFEDLGLKFQVENFLPGFVKTKVSSVEKVNSAGNKLDCAGFKNELLQQRLEDLEKELAVFRKENAKLSRQKQDFEEERVAFQKQKREFDMRVKKFHEEDEAQLAEERKKLHRERLVFEKYTKEVRSKPNKQEREEIKHLKHEVEELKKELERREAKSGSTLARLRNQMKLMEKDKDSLREEIITLQKESTQKQLISKGLKLTDSMTNTKIIHAINRQLSQLTPEDIEELLNKREQILKKPQIINKSQTGPKTTMEPRKPTLKKSANPRKNHKKVQINIENGSDFFESDNSDSIADAVRKPVLKAVYPEEDIILKQYEEEFFNKKDPLLSRLSAESEAKGDIIECISIDGNREKIFPDGRKEIWFPNGNVKKISPDGNTIKIIYYNGDVKERTVADNLVKYYYAESKTWHTTYSDGLEILEFSNGQIEKRLTNGIVEISFPNGCGRKIFPDGQEEWIFSDRSVLKTDRKTGYRMLELPNGQKEIHTAEYKKREFPDGTVKLVYPDGTQETRYASGRIRLKDKNGKLIMDSDVK